MGLHAAVPGWLHVCKGREVLKYYSLEDGGIFERVHGIQRVGQSTGGICQHGQRL